MVSIILPVYNSEEYIKGTLDSIINQTYNDWELIIVDDCSKDGTKKIIELYVDNRIKLIVNEKNIGAALSRNKAIQLATGRYIAFIDSDDRWKKEKLEKQIKFMNDNNIAFSFTAYERVKEKKDKILKIVEVPENIEYLELLKNTIILNSTVILDTSKINKKLIEMPNIEVGEDVATWLKILRTGITAYGYNEVLTRYMIRKKSLSSNKFKNTIQMWKIYKNYENLSLCKRIKNIVRYAKNATKKRI